MKQRYFLHIIAILLCHPVFAQGISSDSLFYHKAISSTRSQYMKALGGDAYLYNGTAYERYWYGVQGHPFFLTDIFSNGAVYYNGVFYENVPLLYDMLHDELVSKDFSGKVQVKMLTEKVRYFTIGKHTFIRIAADSTNTSSLSSGFYEKMYDGVVTVLVKRTHVVIRMLKPDDSYGKIGQGDAQFKEYDHYYIQKEGVYHAINSEADLQSLFRDRKADIRKFLNRKEIKFKKDPAQAILETVAYYAGLKK